MFRKGAIVSITVVITAVLVRNYKSSNQLKAPIVEISSGKVQGVISTSRDGNQFFEYLGIPYAQPPVNHLRFEPPEPAEKWDGVRDASEYGPKCLQVDLFFSMIEGSEDCLQLNVHTPKIDSDASKDKSLLPVMVWIHGGIFIFGSGILYRPDYFMTKEVVLVTINYRLASLGFLNTGDGVIRGNMGLKDQNLALIWVRDNIEMFGGDPNSVTLFGESAGGASAHFHMVSPVSRGLFHKIIAQSGMSSMPWALQKSPEEQAKRFADKLNCTTIDTKLMVSCMKSRSAFEVITAHYETLDPLRETISVFVPTIELNIPDGKTFLSESPQKLISSGNFATVPGIYGINAGEGLINSAVVYRNETVINLLRSNWQKWIPRLLYLPDNTAPEVLEKLKEFYIQDGLLNDLTSFHEFENVTNMFSDRFWNIQFHNEIKSQIKYSTPRSPVYLYYYNYDGEFTLTGILLALKGRFHPIVEILSSMLRTWVGTTFLGEEVPRFGICHGDEIAMQFYIPLPLMPFVPPGHIDYQFSKEIVNLWISFAKSSPNEDIHLEFMGKEWPRQQPNETLKYMKLDSTPSIISEPFQKRVEFWNSIVDNNCI